MEPNDNENDNDDVARSQLGDVACLTKAKNVELTVEEAVQYLRMKDSNNVTSVPPVLPKSGEVYLFVSDDSSKSGSS